MTYKVSKAQIPIKYITDYSPVINYAYTDETVYAGDVNGGGYTDILLYNTSVSPHTVKVLMSNEQANSLAYNHNASWDVTLNANETLWDVKDINGDGKVDLLTKEPNGANWDIKIRENTNNNFNTIHIAGSVVNTYNRLGTINYDASGHLDIYCANTNSNDASNIIVKTVNNFAFSGTKTFINNNTNLFVNTSKVHFFTGHFTQSSTEELAYVTETINGNNSNYIVQTIKEVNGNLDLAFGTNYSGTSEQRFYTGKFTNDNFTDIAAVIKYYLVSKIEILHNTVGSQFDTNNAVNPASNFFLWQDNLTNPPTYFAIGAGDFATNSTKSDMLLLQTAPNGTPYLGEIYLEINTGNNSFQLTEMVEKPCGANPVQVAANDYQMIPMQMDGTGKEDYILWHPGLSFLKVGLMKSMNAIQNPNTEGYCWPMSAKYDAVAPETINFYIKGNNDVSIDIMQYTSRGATVNKIPTGQATYTITPTQANQNTAVVTMGCGWSSNYSLTIPANWESGYYAAQVSDAECNIFEIPFIVKSSSVNAKKLVLLANTNTWAAYNNYTNNATAGSKYGAPIPASNRIYSLFRPLSGTGMAISSNERPGYARGELWIYTWLKDYLGYAPDVVTDIDLHLNNFNLNSYKYFVMGTHPEYWTAQMYDHVKDFQTNGDAGKGGNLICIGGNAVFEVVELDLSDANNPKMIVYPDAPGGATTQHNGQYPLPNTWAGVGGLAGVSPYLNNNNLVYDRFDYFYETYNFGSDATPVYKRTIDLTGVHYQNFNSINGNNTSYNVSQPGHILMSGVNNNTIGINGYCSQGGVDINGSAGASGWECERYTAAVAPDANTPASPIQTLSIYDNDIQILASATANANSLPYAQGGVYCPNGMNNSEIVYVPPRCSSPKRGFVFTAGSITFGGSLVWDYDAATQTYNNDLSTLMKNVLDQPHLSIDVIAHHVACDNTPGSIEATSCYGNTVQYNLQPVNVNNNDGIFLGLVAGTYTLTATLTVNNIPYTVTKTIVINGPTTNHCACVQGEDLVIDPDVILLNSPTATDINNTYAGANGQINNRTFYIDDVLTIDQDITFNNCTLWFTPQGSVQLVGPVQFTTNNTVMQAACDEWIGIYTNDPQQKVIFNNATIQQMVVGVQITNNASIVAQNSSFVNNINNSISFLDYNNTQVDTKIENCTFMGSGQTIPFNAIYIQNYNNIQIGNASNIAQGNLFKDLQNGIEISGGGNIAGIIGSNSNQIDLYNNRFENIAFAPDQSNYNLYMNSIYNQPKGAGVYIDYTQAPAFSANTSILHTGIATSPAPTFDNCYKAIVSKNNNLQVEKQYIKNADFGIMNYNLMSKDVSVQGNKIENAHIGTQVSGNYKNYLVKNNDIRINAGVEISNAGFGMMAMMYPAIGIDIKQNNPPYVAAQQFVVDANTIRIPYYAGKGIANQGANESQTLKNNNILFTVANGTPQSQIAYIDPGLYGIMNSNTKGIKLQSNLVDGQYSLALYNLTFSRGFYFETSTDMAIYCNKARATRQGLYAWGKNETDPKNIKNNKFKYNRNPLFTLDNGANQIGTFGDIGDGVDDNGNDWVYGMSNAQQSTWLQNGQFKIWRQSSQPAQATIYTDASLLLQSQSGSLVIGSADYGVDNNVTPIADPCPDPAFGNSVEPNNAISWSNMDAAIAEYLAQQQQTYIAYADVGEWWNNRNLYERLSYDTSLLNSSAILQSFYANYGNSTIHELVAAGMGMQALFDFSGDSITLDALYNDALNHNYAANSNNDAELYEKSINEMILLCTRYGIDSLSEVQKTELEFIAHLCPFAAGPAVYKARVLYTALNPVTQYYDRLMCVQNMGQNKNGETSYVNLDSLYEAEADKLGAEFVTRNEQNSITNALLKEDKTSSTADDVVTLYPNPATTTVIIAYRKELDGVFTLFNVLGEKVLQTTLSKLNSKTQIPILDVANGVYHYEIQFGTEKKVNGKLNIIK